MRGDIITQRRRQLISTAQNRQITKHPITVEVRRIVALRRIVASVLQTLLITKIQQEENLVILCSPSRAWRSVHESGGLWVRPPPLMTIFDKWTFVIDARQCCPSNTSVCSRFQAELQPVYCLSCLWCRFDSALRMGLYAAELTVRLYKANPISIVDALRINLFWIERKLPVFGQGQGPRCEAVMNGACTNRMRSNNN